MHRPVVAQAPLRPRARLNLAPRLHGDETLASWLERFAGAYGMTLRDFFLWLGYPDFFRHADNRYDLDASRPPDLAGVLAAHAGLDAQLLAAPRLDGASALAPQRRRAFCPECWAEEGPYRRIEWAHGWSLVCRRHRRLLRERPLPKGPNVHWSEESWTEFYRDPSAWRDLRPSWQSEPWTRICACLGVEPHAEFRRAWAWLLELSRPGPGLDQALPVDELTVKEDLALYGMIRFFESSLLQALDDTLSRRDLMEESSGGSLCDVRTPQAPYGIRLFGAMVGRHLWVRLTRGEWRCGRHEVLAQVVENSKRWNDEDWWLEQRLRTWPPPLAASGRGLFRRTDPFVLLPPWERCRECLRGVQGAVRGAFDIALPESWRCLSWAPSVASEFAAILERLYSSGVLGPRRSAAALDCTAPD